MQGIEKYKGEVAIEAQWLIENEVMSEANYKLLAHNRDK